MSGIYVAYYTGAVGSGFALILMKSGVIAGADAGGGVISGSYADEGDGLIELDITLSVPPGTQLVTGAIAGEQSIAVEIRAKLPANLGNGTPLPLQTSTGPINIIFKRLRDVP